MEKRVISIDYGFRHLSEYDLMTINSGIDGGKSVIAHPKASVMVIEPTSAAGQKIAELNGQLNGIIFHDKSIRGEILETAFRETHDPQEPLPKF